MASEVVKLAQQLISIPSINPQDTDVLTEPYGEKRIAAFIFDWFDKHGLNPQKQTAAPDRENIFSLTKGTDTSKTLLLTCHTDTVDIKGMTVDPFAAEIKEEKIYGRGACDDKGPLAAIMIAYRDRVKAAPLPYNLIFLATCGEEYSMAGSEFFRDNAPTEITAAIFAEPTNLSIVVAHKGVVRLRLETKGQSAHSSTPESGKNAIYPMAEAILASRDFIDTLDKKTEHPMLGHEKAAVTIVNGGQQINIIPDKCTAMIDWRFLPDRSAEICRNELRDYLKEKLNDQVTVEAINSFSPMQTDRNHPLITKLLDAAEKTAQIRQKSIFSGATDASSFHSLNIPTPVFGPGNTAQAHTKDEFIEINQLENGLAAYKAFLENDWGI